VDVDTSETSSYHSSEGEQEARSCPQPAALIEESKDGNALAAGVKKGRKQKGGGGGDAVMADGDAGGEDNEMSTYSKFKTQNELDIEKAFQSGPKFMELDELDEMKEFGTIRQFINQGIGMVLV